MNINKFKEGDLITRNAPVLYGSDTGKGDSSWCGSKIRLLGVDEESKIIFINIEERPFFGEEEPTTVSYARDAWDEGWVKYPIGLFEKVKNLLTPNPSVG